MKDRLKKIQDAYKNKDYDKYLRFVKEDIRLNSIVEYETILCEIKLLINIREYEKAHTIIKKLEKQIDKYDIAEDICRLYLRCFKPIDAERIYFSKKTQIKDKLLLIEIYLLQGKIKEANQAIEKCLETPLTPYEQDKIRWLKKCIDNNTKYGAFIEIEYSSFIKQGNKLQKGHIVFLKKSPDTNKLNDPKKGNRPYMIWKIEGDKVYMFSVSTNCKKRDYKLLNQKYPNSLGDRVITDSLYQTTINNILSVKDKVLESDYHAILKNIFKNNYYYPERATSKIKFMKEYVGEPQINDIIEYINPQTRELHHFLVIGKEKMGYIVIEVDTEYNLPKEKHAKIFPYYELIYRIVDYESNKPKLSYLLKEQKNGKQIKAS